MTKDEIVSYLTETFEHIVPKVSWGETSFFVNPGKQLPSGTYFATIKDKDGEHDRASDLDRSGAFRLNFGPGRDAFTALFGAPPARPAKGCVIDGHWDFTECNRLVPHPVYGWMSWMAVINPDDETFHQCKPLLEKAYIRALMTTEKKLKGRQ